MPRLTSVADLAVWRYLYAPIQKSGKRDHNIDLRLQQLESVLGEIWPAVATGYLDIDKDVHRKALALFVATLYTRHPKRIADYESMHRLIVEVFEHWPTGSDGNPVLSAVVLNQDVGAVDPSDWPEFKSASTADMHRGFAETVVSSVSAIAPILLRRRWAIVVSEKPVFATCDSPLVLANTLTKTFGFGTTGTSVYLPLSPFRFLVIDDKELPSGYYANKPGFAEAMNYLTWCAADRYLISMQESHQVLDGILRFADAHGLP